MPRISANMEPMGCGVILHADSRCQGIGHAKRNERNLELLMQKTEYLIGMRDSVKEGKIKELMFGTIQTKDCQNWLNKEKEIEKHVDDILRFYKEGSDGLMISSMKLPQRNLMNTLDEITHHLENFPLEHGSVVHAPLRAAKTVTSPKIEGKTYGHVEKTKNVNEKREVEAKAQSLVEFQALPDICGTVLGEEKNVGYTEPETWGITPVRFKHVVGIEKYGEVEKNKNVKLKRKFRTKPIKMPEGTSRSEFRSKVQALAFRNPRFELEDDVTSATSSDVEVFTKSQSAADQISTSSIETTTDSLPMSTSCESNRGLPMHATEPMETISGGNGRAAIHEIELETVPYQNKGGQAKPKFSESTKQSVEAAGSVAVLRSSPSNITAAEPVTVSSSRKEDEIPPVNKVETEVSYETDRDQWLFESGVDVNGSIERTVLEIFRCMSDAMSTKIGVCGIGGIGKTSVLKTLISHPETKCTFDLIVLVAVSRYRSSRKIQNEILRQLSLNRKDFETDSQVAEKLSQVFSEKKFLLLLDDVWEQIDFKAVGIPDPRAENGSKILMASRKSDVFRDMDIIKVIVMEPVSAKEAWELFYEQVGQITDLPNIQSFAQAIVKGCGGLPLLIIVTGRALAEENNVSAWEQASRKFSLASVAGIHNIENIIQLLKFSFDRIKDHVIKSCFLHCCLFSEDQEINISDFIEYCIQEGIITGSQADAHKRGNFIVDALLRASLLQVTEGGDSIKMHDLIRDLALGILSSAGEGSQFLLGAYSRLTEPSNAENSFLSRSLPSPENSKLFVPEGHQFLFRAGEGLTEPPLEEEWKHAKMIFLMDNELCTLPERPICPKLSILFLQRNYQLRAITPSFFDFMTSLKVLNLSKTRIKSLPKTLFKLKNLEILILRDCERLAMLPSEVGYLQSLEVLDLGGTEISKLPTEIGKLASLRHLDVSVYGSINNSEYSNLPHELISSGTISRLHALETLSIVVYPGDQRWYETVKFVITEISNLTELHSLCLHFPEPELLELFLQSSMAWNAQSLRNFKFVVGHDVKSITSRVPNHLVFDYNQQIRCLRFVNGEKTPNAVLRTLAWCTAFYLDHHVDICSLTNFGVGNINGLEFCIISECPKIETVVDSKELTETVFPSLKNLSIHHLWNLTCIWEGIVPKGSFAELRILSVNACPKLRYVFNSSIIQLVSKLEELVVEDCPAMTEIIHEDEIIDSNCIMLPNLKKLTLHYLPALVNIWTSAWPSLEHVSFYDCPRLKKIGADSKLMNIILDIKAEKSWWDALEWEDRELQLHLQNCFTAINEDDL